MLKRFLHNTKLAVQSAVNGCELTTQVPAGQPQVTVITQQQPQQHVIVAQPQTYPPRTCLYRCIQ